MMTKPKDTSGRIGDFEKLYTTDEVAELFAVSKYTIRDWIRSGKLTALKFNNTWRITHSEIIRLGGKRHGDG